MITLSFDTVAEYNDFIKAAQTPVVARDMAVAGSASAAKAKHQRSRCEMSEDLRKGPGVKSIHHQMIERLLQGHVYSVPDDEGVFPNTGVSRQLNRIRRIAATVAANTGKTFSTFVEDGVVFVRRLPNGAWGNGRAVRRGRPQ